MYTILEPEANGVMSDKADEWVSEENGKFDMIFQFEYLNLWDEERKDGFNVKKYKTIMNKWQNDLENKGWNALFIENHDIPRSVSNWGNDKEYWEKSAKAFAVAYMLQKGTPFIYQGQEIGMTNVVFDSIEDYSDIKCINIYKDKIANGFDKKDAMKDVYAISRDNARTPMQWSNDLNGGFSSGKPWIKVNPNYTKINVQNEKYDSESILNFYKNLIKIRNNNDTLIYGKFKAILEDDENIFAYIREGEKNKFIIICNLTDSEALCKYTNKTLNNENLILSNYDIKNDCDLDIFSFKPYECRIYKINK